jgi:Copper resistance protein K
MKNVLRALALSLAIGTVTSAYADEPAAEKVELKDGNTLYLHPDGTGRMVDQHGKAMDMADGESMEAVDGRVIMMKNKHVWIQYGPPGKGPRVLKHD